VIGSDANDAAIIYQAGPQLARLTIASFGAYRGKGQVATRWDASFRKMFKTPPPDDSAISGADAVYQIAYAVRKAGTDDPEKVYQTLNNAVNIVTVSGLTTYKGKGGVPVKPFAIFRFDLKKKQKIQEKLVFAKKIPPPRS
jgi:branched-chain amino acid transport system substrate-binding protein